MRSVLLNTLITSFVIFSSNLLAAPSNLERRVKALEDRLALLEVKINKEKGIAMQRKPSCPDTCNCGPDCACSNCKCGVKESKNCGKASCPATCDCGPECKCNFCECGIEKSK